MNKEQFAPCPFCGKSDTLTIGKASDAFAEPDECGDPLPYMHTESYSVICDASKPDGPGGCGASGGYKLTEDEAIAAWNRRAEVGRLAAQAAPTEEVSPEFTDTARAALLWVLWHHQGASSKVGQPIRFALGMGSHDALNEYQVREAHRWEAIAPTQDAANVPPGEWSSESEGLTPKQAWWAGYRIGKGLPYDMPRLEAAVAQPPAQAEPAPAPFAKDSWQHAVDNHLSALGKTSEEFPNPHEAVRWLLEFTSTLPVDAPAPVGEVRLLTSKDIADVRETLWRNTQVNLSDLHAEDAAKAFQRKFCEVNGLTVKEQS